MTNFIKGLNPLRTIFSIICALLTAGFLWFVVDFIDAKYKAEAEVARLEQVVTDAAEANRMLNIQIEQHKEAEETADAVTSELETLRSDYAMIQRAIASAKDEDDGEIAPVLRRALDDIGRMRH